MSCFSRSEKHGFLTFGVVSRAGINTSIVMFAASCTPPCYEYQKMGLIKNGTTCVTKTTTHTSKKLRKWPNRDRTTPSSMALFGHYLAKNHPTKNAIEQKYSPRARASSGHAPWRCPTDFPFHGFPPALLTIFYIMNRQQGSRSG